MITATAKTLRSKVLFALRRLAWLSPEDWGGNVFSVIFSPSFLIVLLFLIC
jgi:hypothetical protein